MKTNALLSDEVIAQLNAGVEMKRGDLAQPLSVRRREDRGKYTWLDVVLTEGKNREVRRMVEAVGFKVLKLVRTRIGPLTLEGLQVGKWRELTPGEVACSSEGKNALEMRGEILVQTLCLTSFSNVNLPRSSRLASQFVSRSGISTNPEAKCGILLIDYRAFFGPSSYTIERKVQAPGQCQLSLQAISSMPTR